MSAPAAVTPVGRRAYLFILITVLLDVIALGIGIPVWPELIEGFTGKGPNAGLWVGLLGALWALTQFFFQPTIGALSDRIGRRPIVLASNFGTGIDYAIMAMAPSLSWLLIGRVISGITTAAFGTAFAYIADTTEAEKRAAAFGLIGATFGLGFILGPVIGGHLADPSFSVSLGGWVIHGSARLPFWVAGVLSLLNAAYGFFVLPESLPPERREAFVWSRANPLGSLELLRSHRELFSLASVQFLAQLAHYVLQTLFVLYAGDRYGWGPDTLGKVMAAVGVCSAAVQGGLTGPVVKRLGERRTVTVALLFGAAGFALYGAAPTGALFLVGIPVMSLWGMSGAAVQSLMSRRVSPSEQGKLQGANMSLASIAGIIGPMMYGGLYGLFTGPLAGLGQPGAPFYVAASLLVVAMLVARSAVSAGEGAPRSAAALA